MQAIADTLHAWRTRMDGQPPETVEMYLHECAIIKMMLDRTSDFQRATAHGNVDEAVSALLNLAGTAAWIVETITPTGVTNFTPDFDLDQQE